LLKALLSVASFEALLPCWKVALSGVLEASDERRFAFLGLLDYFFRLRLSSRHVVDALLPITEVLAATFAIALVCGAVLSVFVTAVALSSPLQSSVFVSGSLARSEALLSVAVGEVLHSARKVASTFILETSEKGRFLGFLLQISEVDLKTCGFVASSGDVSVVESGDEIDRRICCRIWR